MYEKLMGELEHEDVAGFRNFIRMEPGRFYELLQRISNSHHEAERGLGNLWTGSEAVHRTLLLCCRGQLPLPHVQLQSGF